MRCPKCRRHAQVASVRYTELAGDNSLVPVNLAVLTCGCSAPLADVAANDPAEWSRNVRRRIDENLRGVFT